MAFKRYIHRHGKKLGPYYYENVRSNDGRVKSVYLGTNPDHHPKHRIRKPLFFLILVLVLILILLGSLFFLQNKSYLVKKVRPQQADFDIDQILLKVLIRSGEFIEKQARIMNTGEEPAAIDVEVLGLADVVKIDSPSFIIKPGQTKILALNFSSFVPEQKIEQHPGVYVGKLIVKSHKAAKEVPIVVEIETKNVLFDMNLNPVAIERKVKQGSDTTIEVRLFNLESIESVNVDVEYFVKDMSGNTIITESETVVVKTQASFFKTISIPKNLKPGPYVFAALSRFGNSVGTSSYMFEVIGPEAEASFVEFCKNSVLCLGLSLTTILLLFALIAYFYFFIGAYLYEKITGVVTIPRKGKPEAQEEIEKAGIFDLISAKIRGWNESSERKRARKKSLEKEKELQKLAEERNAQLEAKRRQIEEEKRKQEALRKQKEVERQKEEEQLKKQLEKEKTSKARKEKFKALLHGIGLFRTPEEKKQIELKREREAQEKLRIAEQLKKQKEVEARKREEEKQKQRLGEEKIRQEEQRQKGQLEKQKELERQKALEQKRTLEEERKTREEQLKRQKELENQKQAQLKAQKLQGIRQLEEKIRSSKEAAEQLNSQLKKLESEKRALSSETNEIDARVKKIDDEILSKSRHSEELSQQKAAAFDKYKKQIDDAAKKEENEKASMAGKAQELKAKFAEKQNAMLRGLEDELDKLPLAKRKATEKWKRLEIKAKLKVEEHNAGEEIKKLAEKAIDGKKSIDDGYKKSADDLSKKQDEIKREISGLEKQKQEVLLEKKSLPRDLLVKDSEIQRLALKLEELAKERKQLSEELSRLRAEVSKFNLNFLRKLVSGYKEKVQKARKERAEIKAKIDEDKRKQEEGLRKQKEQDEKLRKIEEAKKREEEQKKAKEEQRLMLLEEKKKQKESKLQLEEEKEKKPGAIAEKKGMFERFFRKKPEIELKKEEFEEDKKAGLGERKRKEELKRLEAEEEDIGKIEDEKRRQEQESLEEEIKLEKDLEKKEKPGFFAGFFGKKPQEEKPEIEEEAEEKSTGQKKPKSEADELEDAIRSLDLFKKIEEGKPTLKEEKKPSILSRLFKKEPVAKEEGKGFRGEKPAAAEKPKIIGKLEREKAKEPLKEEIKKQVKEKPEKKITGSKNYIRCHKALEDARDAIEKGSLPKAKKLYLEARELYVRLDYKEKKEIYGDLMSLYNRLSK